MCFDDDYGYNKQRSVGGLFFFFRDTKIAVWGLYDSKKSELLKNILQGTENSYIYSLE